MKARVIATGKIVEVSQGIYSPYQYVDNNGTIYTEEQLEILQEELALTIDYWTRLEHQAAIAAMQGLMSILPQIGGIEGRSKQTEVIDIATSVAHALVEKYKKEERK